MSEEKGLDVLTKYKLVSITEIDRITLISELEGLLEDFKKTLVINDDSKEVIPKKSDELTILILKCEKINRLKAFAKFAKQITDLW